MEWIGGLLGALIGIAIAGLVILVLGEPAQMAEFIGWFVALGFIGGIVWEWVATREKK